VRSSNKEIIADVNAFARLQIPVTSNGIFGCYIIGNRPIIFFSTNAYLKKHLNFKKVIEALEPLDGQK
jgi:hypothetical protein